MVTCFYVHVFWHSHASIFTCFDDHILLCSHAFMMVFSYVYMLWQQMSTCLNALMLIFRRLIWLDSYMLKCFIDYEHLCSHATMMECFFIYMLWWSHAHLHVCPLACMPSRSYAWTPWWLPTTILKCFDDCMLTCIDIHMFDIHTHVHTLGWWNVYWLEG